MAEYEEIIIEWQKRRELANLNNVENEDKILYQIYGDSHIYGRDVLMYIGKTTRNCLFREREHLKSYMKYAQNLTVSIGFIEQSIDLVIPESILIANHKPSFNKQYLHDISQSAKEHKIIVINNGIHGMLKTCCTNFWWVDSKGKDKNVPIDKPETITVQGDDFPSLI